MTPTDFCNAYLPTAQRVRAGTGIGALVLLAQWANETDWSQSWEGRPYNLANIRNGAGGAIVTYPSLDAFVVGCVATWHNGFYNAVLAAQGDQAQLAAICASPWSSGHYGGSLEGFYQPITEVLMNLSEKRAVIRDTYNAVLGRQPENYVALDSWATQILDDGSNEEQVVAAIESTQEAQEWLARLAAIRALTPAQLAAALQAVAPAGGDDDSALATKADLVHHTHHNDGADPASAPTGPAILAP